MRIKSLFFILLSLLQLVSCNDSSEIVVVNTPATELVCPEVSLVEDLLNSTSHRSRSSDVLSVKSFRNHFINSTLPGQYSTQSDVFIDDDSYQHIVDSAITHPSASVCGTTGELTDRIQDCNKSFDAATDGNSSEGKWSLVTKILNIELWRDSQSGLIFSSAISKVNWCKAAGNSQQILNSNNNLLFDCSTISAGENTCANLGNDLGIKMKLPTKNDFLRAEISGLRILWPNWATSNLKFWSGTVQSDKRDYAWTYNARYGQMTTTRVNNTATWTICVAEI